MLIIKILGPGCYNCYRVREVTMAALQTLADDDSGLEVTIQHVEDPQEIQK